MKDTHKRAHRNLGLSTITEVFINQKSMNVCEHTLKMVPCMFTYIPALLINIHL